MMWNSEILDDEEVRHANGVEARKFYAGRVGEVD